MMLVDVYLLKFLRCQCTLNYGFALYLFTFFLCLKQGSLWFGLGRGAGRVSGQGGQNSARSAEKKFSFAHPGFQFAHPAIRNGCPPCPPYRGGFKGKGLIGH